MTVRPFNKARPFSMKMRPFSNKFRPFRIQMQHLGHDASIDMRPLKKRPSRMKINFCASHCLKFPVPQDWPEPTPLHQGPAPRHLGELPARRSEASPAQELPVVRTEASLDAEPKGAVQTKSLAEKPAAVHNRSLAKEPVAARNPNLAEEPAAVHDPSLAEEPALLQLSTLPAPASIKT